MFGVNSVSQIGDIIEGHYKEITNKENNLYEQRIAVCRQCPLYTKKENIGEVCDGTKCWDPNKEILETFPSRNNICGCGCRLAAKTRVKNAKCVLSRWPI